MKCSTRNNFGNLIKDELVKRFEQLTKDEITRHNVAIEKTNRDITCLKNLFEEHKDLLYQIKYENQKSFQDLKEYFDKVTEHIENKYNSHSSSIGQSAKNVDLILKDLESKIEGLVGIDIFIENKNEFMNCILNLQKEIKDERIKHKNYIFELYSSHREKLQEEITLVEKKVSEIKNRTDKFEKDLETNIVDAQGISRMIKVDQKTMFIMEKKIENLYTEIERLKLRIL